MTHSMQPIIQHLFQTDSLENVSVERLAAFVEEYPSFGIGHYLLSSKLKVEDTGRFAGETQRTSLYFTNPFWLQWMLENSGPEAAVAAPAAFEWTTPETEVPTLTVTEEPAEALETEPAGALPVESMPEPPLEPVVTPDEPVVILDEPAMSPVETAQEVTAEEPIRDEEPPFVLPETETGKDTTGTAVAGTDLSAAELLLQSIREAHGLRQSLQRINEDLTHPPPYKEEPAIGISREEEEEPAPEEDGAMIENANLTSPGTIGAAVERAARAAGISEETEKEGAEGGITAHAIALAEEPGAQQELPAELQNQAAPPAEQTVPPAEQPTVNAAAEQPLVFEPYHTIDYFASQGIKLTLDENPSDTLGRQLKSFTDWLKVMRRLPQKDREIIPDIAAERNVQTSAAHSIEGKEVVTETMAEVLAKQGMKEKAREVYNKLSLLDPGKRAYFATKIEQLNIP